MDLGEGGRHGVRGREASEAEGGRQSGRGRQSEGGRVRELRRQVGREEGGR